MLEFLLFLLSRSFGYLSFDIFFIDDVRMATLAIGGMMNWIYTWYSPAGRLTSEVIAQHMADYALRIVGAAPAPSSGR